MSTIWSLAICLASGAALGFIYRPLVRKWWKGRDKDADAKMDAVEAAAYAKGMAEALSVIVDTDENAAIVEAIGANILQQEGVRQVSVTAALAAEESDKAMWQFYLAGGYGYSRGHFEDRGWNWIDPKLTRASLRAGGDTPRAAYKSYLAQRAAADAICEQLDEVERIRTEGMS